MKTLWLGTADYHATWQLQRELAEMRAAGRIADTLLLLEHPPTLTLGRAADRAHVLAEPEELAAAGIAVHAIDRGGDVTYHGPGQLVGYPIVDLGARGKDLHAYLREIEECLMEALGFFGLSARRFPPHTGVWVGDEKIAAIGIKVSRWVSMHGFALNVCPNMAHFATIVPCGIRDYGVTSLAAQLQRPTTVAEAITPVRAAFEAHFPTPHDAPPLPLDAFTDESKKTAKLALDVL